MADQPFLQSYWVHPGLLCVGHYPGAPDLAGRDAKLAGLLRCGLRRVINLMEPTETGHGGVPFAPYLPRLCELANVQGTSIEWLGIPLHDGVAPLAEQINEVLDAIDEGMSRGRPTYLHCWGGHGRTSTVVACHLIRHGHSPADALAAVSRMRAELPKHHDPFEGGQRAFVMAWSPQPGR